MSDSRKLKGTERFTAKRFLEIWNSVPVSEGSFDLVFAKFATEAQSMRKAAIKEGRWSYDEWIMKKYIITTAKNLRKELWPLKLHAIPSLRGKHKRSSLRDKVAMSYIQLIDDGVMTAKEAVEIIKYNKKQAKSDRDKLKQHTILEHVKAELLEKRNVKIK